MWENMCRRHKNRHLSYLLTVEKKTPQKKHLHNCLLEQKACNWVNHRVRMFTLSDHMMSDHMIHLVWPYINRDYKLYNYDSMATLLFNQDFTSMNLRLTWVQNDKCFPQVYPNSYQVWWTLSSLIFRNHSFPDV